MLMSADKYGEFWNFISQPQKDLILQGDYMVQEVIEDSKYSFKDYSFLVFPYAKAYEGFLKQIFKDVHFISHLDYISDHLRLGKLMSPNLVGRLGDRSLYRRVRDNASVELADKIWDTWKEGRNQIFHYFPHNLKAISYRDAQLIIANLISTMQETYEKLSPLMGQHTNTHA